MLNKNIIEEINSKVSEILQNSPAKDVERNVRAALSGVFSRLDLVTRDEFDVQQNVLQRTREKLTQLEAKVAELEQRLGISNTGNGTTAAGAFRAQPDSTQGQDATAQSAEASPSNAT
ncbi:MAG: accessory factor UbiK family protein [Nitrosomonas sp.]|nr:accessory factor UbiK family protein [Nitrosomonas sp.]